MKKKPANKKRSGGVLSIDSYSLMRDPDGPGLKACDCLTQREGGIVS